MCNEIDTNAFREVSASITRGPKCTIEDAKTGPLQDGTAVMMRDHAAYWVNGGRAYAANGHAMAWSPALPVAPTGISFSEVESAVSE